jgi:CubicO group peptidase (beta-lactamase class C family)
MRNKCLWAAIVLLAACLGEVGAPAASHEDPTRAVKRLDGSSITPKEIDATVTRLLRDGKVTGAGIAIFNDGTITYLKAYGYRDKEKGLPLTADSVMTSASLSKSIFAYMVMQLVQEKILDLDKPVYQYLPMPLPEYRFYRDLAGDERYKKITLRMLLSHTSGFPNWRAFTDGKLEIHFEPGTRFAYSGEGIDLAQLVVEEVTHKPLDELMHERVFDPLGMRNTDMLWQELFEKDFANAYDEDENSLGPQRRTRADAAGSMQTTLRDYALFLQALAQGKGLAPATRDLMLSPQIAIVSKHQFPSLDSETTDENKAICLSYGLGWGLYWSPYGRAFFKEGHDEGWRHYAVYFDKAGSGMLIMTNSSNGEGIYQALLETLLADTYTPIEWESFTPYTALPPGVAIIKPREVAVAPAALQSYAGRYEAQPGEILTISAEDGHLYMQENNGPRVELFASGERQFFAKSFDLQIEFVVDAHGHTASLTSQAPSKGISFAAKRIP